jgi:hypothetical protein
MFLQEALRNDPNLLSNSGLLSQPSLFQQQQQQQLQQQQQQQQQQQLLLGGLRPPDASTAAAEQQQNHSNRSDGDQYSDLIRSMLYGGPKPNP